MTADRQLNQDLPGLNPAGSLGNPELCLLYYPSDDVYQAIILSLDNEDQFNAAKADAVNRLSAAGMDSCSIVLWQGQGPQALQLSIDEQLDLPVTCTPRVVTGDIGAATWVPAVRDALARTMAATLDQLDWQPNRPSIVKIFTDINAAAPAYHQYLLGVLPSETADSITQGAHDGEIWYVTMPNGDLSDLPLVNLTRPVDQNLARVSDEIAQLWTLFAAAGIGGSSGTSAQWYRQGLGSYQSERNAGAAHGYLAIAGGLQNQGRELHLQDLETQATYLAQKQSQGQNAVASRSHAAVVYLIEQYGFSRVLQLLRDNYNGSLAQFNQLLAQLTGMDTAALDSAVGTWLTGVTSIQATGSSGFSLSLTLSPATSYGEATVTLNQPLTCGSLTLASGTKITFTLGVVSGQGVSGTGDYRNGTLSLQGTLANGAAAGTLEYADPAAACDTGALTFS